MNKYFVLILALMFSLQSHSQESLTKFSSLGSIKPMKLKSFSLSEKILLTDSSQPVETKTIRTKKSAGLAFIYGLLLPGMGHVYADKFKSGKYFLIGEGALWLSYAAFSVYGKWLRNDAYSFAERHAGINRSGKNDDDEFYVNIGNYDDVGQYNNEKLLFGEYEKVYYPGTGKDFYWDEVANRKRYREDKLAGERTLNDRLFIVGAILINHVASAISAIFAANSYNDELKGKGGQVDIKADILRYGYKIDGLQIKLTKWF